MYRGDKASLDRKNHPSTSVTADPKEGPTFPCDERPLAQPVSWWQKLVDVCLINDDSNALYHCTHHRDSNPELDSVAS